MGASLSKSRKFGELLLLCTPGCDAESPRRADCAQRLLPEGVAYHTGCSAHECQRLVSAALQVTQHHHAAEVAYVQRVGCRVSAQISSNLLFLQQFFRTRHYLAQHATPFQFFYKVLIHRIFFIFCSLNNKSRTGFFQMSCGPRPDAARHGRRTPLRNNLPTAAALRLWHGGRSRFRPKGCISVCAIWQAPAPLSVRASSRPGVHIQSTWA